MNKEQKQIQEYESMIRRLKSLLVRARVDEEIENLIVDFSEAFDLCEKAYKLINKYN